MSSAAPPPDDAAVPGLLKLLLERFRCGDEAGQHSALEAIGAARLDQVDTVVGALCLGGVDFADRLLAHGHAALGPADRLALVLAAFNAVVDAAPDAPDDHEARTAAGLVERFGLPTPPAQLLDMVRAEFLIAAGPLEEVPEAALAAMRLSQWQLALRGFMRLQQALQDKTPRNVFGVAAMCLHKLGRYAEAEIWSMLGLGGQQALLAIGPVRTEAELRRRWSGRLTPVISIVCTTYNHERYIESALRGFLSQDCPYPFEILIHDDASTDGTQQVIRRWQQDYPNVIKPVLQTENQFSQGVRPWELLLARACGEFVATCEGDDFWVDRLKLRKQVDFLKANPKFSCSAHNYYHYHETALTVRPWSRIGRNFVLSQRQLMAIQTLLWFPTLVFRNTFRALPPERDLAAFGDQFLTSYLGTLGPCAYLETLYGAVRRENEFSFWSPLSKLDKERMRVKTWVALVLMHERLGHAQAVTDLMAKISASALDESSKAALFQAAGCRQPLTLAAA